MTRQEWINSYRDDFEHAMEIGYWKLAAIAVKNLHRIATELSDAEEAEWKDRCDRWGESMARMETLKNG